MTRIHLAVFALVLFAAGCKQPQTEEPASPAAGVSRIVFVGQKDACQCARDRIDASWAALEAVLGPKPAVPVERIQEDVDAAKAEEYAKLKALMVVPGIYFLDAKGKLVELLQGEVKAEQVTAVLKSGD
jgi:hypothetical protein